jgi:TniQ
MRINNGAKKQLPVVLAPVPDELLSSWIARHAAFYGVSLRAMLRHADPDARSLRAVGDHLTDEQGSLLAHIFRRETVDIRRMTFANISSSARRLVAAEPIQMCSTCATKNADVGAKELIMRSWRQAWRITCPVCRSHLSAEGQGSAANSGDGPTSLVPWEEALRGERLLDDYAERGIQTWATPIDLLRLLLIRRNPKPIDPEHWIETPKVLDLVVPGFDRLVAAIGATVPPASKPVLPLSLRPALLAGIAIVERSGPKIVAELHSRTIGAYHAHFGAIAASIFGPKQSISESQLCS